MKSQITPSQPQPKVKAGKLDGVGSWATTTVDGSVKTQSINEMNEYDSFDGAAFVHDDNGNLLDDSQKLFSYDALNRITQIVDKNSNEVIATYKYDFANRRIQKEFTKTEETDGGGGGNGGGEEYTTDADTVALYHYNETSGKVIDSSGNNNHGRSSRRIKRGIDGLFGTKAIKLKGAPILIKKSTSLNSIKDKLTLETFVYIKDKKWRKSSVAKRRYFLL